MKKFAIVGMLRGEGKKNLLSRTRPHGTWVQKGRPEDPWGAAKVVLSTQLASTPDKTVRPTRVRQPLRFALHISAPRSLYALGDSAQKKTRVAQPFAPLVTKTQQVAQPSAPPVTKTFSKRHRWPILLRATVG